MNKALIQIGGLGLLVLALSGLKSMPSKEVRREMTLCEASKVTVPTTVQVTGMVNSYEIKGVNSSLVLTSLDGCRINVLASQDILGPALNHLGKNDAYLKVVGEVKDGSISVKADREFSISEVIRECGVPVLGEWEATGIGDGIRGYTKNTFNSMPYAISVKPEIKESIPKDGQWYEGCSETTNGIRQIVSVSRR